MKIFKKIFIIFIIIFTLTTAFSCDDNNKKDDKIVVNFDSQGGSNVDSISLTVDEAGNFVLPENPQKEGLVFAGWFFDRSFKREFKSLDPIPSEITLYAKWINPNDLTNTGISFKIAIDDDLKIDEKITLGAEEDSVQLELSVGKKSIITIDCSLFMGTNYDIEDLNLALVVDIDSIYNLNGSSAPAEKNEFKLYVKNGVLYTSIPQSRGVKNYQSNISIDLVKLYNDNIELLKNEIKKLIKIIKEIPLENLPDGFDLSVLDRIDVDNLKMEDFLTLIEVLPEDVRNQVMNIEDSSFDSLFGMLKEYLLPELDGEITEEDLDEIKKYLKDILDIFKKLVPVETKDGKTTRWEITDEQIKGVIAEIGEYLSNNIDGIYPLLDKISSLISELDDENNPLPKDNDEIDMKKELEKVASIFKENLNNSFDIKNCFGEVNMGVLLPNSIKGLLEISVNIKGEDWPNYLDHQDDYIKIDEKLSLDMTPAIVSVTLEFPDFSSYVDRTSAVNDQIAEMINELDKSITDSSNNLKK